MDERKTREDVLHELLENAGTEIERLKKALKRRTEQRDILYKVLQHYLEDDPGDEEKQEA